MFILRESYISPDSLLSPQKYVCTPNTQAGQGVRRRCNIVMLHPCQYLPSYNSRHELHHPPPPLHTHIQSINLTLCTGALLGCGEYFIDNVVVPRVRVCVPEVAEVEALAQ